MRIVIKKSVYEEILTMRKAYNPNQPRTQNGRWVSGGSDSTEISPREQLRKNLKDGLKDSINKPVKNEKTGIYARISSTGINKMSSDKAIEKSKSNGFTIEQHFEVANNVLDLYKKADLVYTGKDEKHNPPDPNIKSIKRFVAQTELKNGVKIDALITVKETDDHRIYSLELDEINKASTRWQTDNSETSNPTARPTTEALNSSIPQSVKKSMPVPMFFFRKNSAGEWHFYIRNKFKFNNLPMGSI